MNNTNNNFLLRPAGISLLQKVKAALGKHYCYDSIGKNKAGQVVVRRGFFYRKGGSSESYEKIIENVLAMTSVGLKIVDRGEINKAFRGGGSTASNSHWYVVISE
jgi:hypothetical protein